MSSREGREEGATSSRTRISTGVRGSKSLVRLQREQPDFRDTDFLLLRRYRPGALRRRRALSRDQRRRRPLAPAEPRRMWRPRMSPFRRRSVGTVGPAGLLPRSRSAAAGPASPTTRRSRFIGRADLASGRARSWQATVSKCLGRARADPRGHRPARPRAAPASGHRSIRSRRPRGFRSRRSTPRHAGRAPRSARRRSAR